MSYKESTLASGGWTILILRTPRSDETDPVPTSDETILALIPCWIKS